MMSTWRLPPTGKLPNKVVVALCVAMLHHAGEKSMVDGRVLLAAERAAAAAAAHPGRPAAQAAAEEAVARVLFGVCSNPTVRLPRQWDNTEQVGVVVTCAASRATALYAPGP